MRSLWLDQIILLDDFSINDFEELGIEELDIDELKQQYDLIFSVKPRKVNWLYKILYSLLKAKKELGYFADGGDFYKNGIFCSYSYILDFDSLKLVIFRCYNNAPEHNLEDWCEKDFNGKWFYMNTLFAMTFDEVRKNKIETILTTIATFLGMNLPN